MDGGAIAGEEEVNRRESSGESCSTAVAVGRGAGEVGVSEEKGVVINKVKLESGRAAISSLSIGNSNSGSTEVGCGRG